MKLIADMHLHMYPAYDSGRALRALLRNLRSAGDSDRLAGFLVERSGCCWFREAASRRRHDLAPGIRLEECRGIAMRISVEGEGDLTLFAGRQIATSERIEVLSLLSDADIADGQSADVTIRAVLDAGGLPVLSWAFGKWFGGRGTLVREAFRRWQSSGILLGDSALRPAAFPESPRFREARSEGVPVLAGSDPLPRPGEEARFGQYVSRLDVTGFDQDPVKSVRDALSRRPSAFPVGGRRCSLPAVLRRVL
jgi:hypothetical protein